MAVYVDDMNLPATVQNGPRVSHTSEWSHLFADTEDELHAFAARLGLKRSYFQQGKPDWFPHYDVTKGKRFQALRLGAEPASARDTAEIGRGRRNAYQAEHLGDDPDQTREAEAPGRRRLLVTGSQLWTDEKAIEDGLRPYFETCPDALLVSGACPRGADAIAERVWTGWGGEVERHPADWEQHGRSAGYVRNAEMVSSHPAACVAFNLDESPGTAHTADLAEAEGIPVTRHAASSQPTEPAAEHAHAWQDSGRLQKTCHGCDTIASRERADSGEWQTVYRPTLRAATAERLRSAGIGPADPALQRLCEHNRMRREAHRQADDDPDADAADEHGGDVNAQRTTGKNHQQEGSDMDISRALSERRNRNGRTREEQAAMDADQQHEVIASDYHAGRIARDEYERQRDALIAAELRQAAADREAGQ